MPCSCGGMRRSGLTPSNIAIRQIQEPKPVRILPPQIHRPIQLVKEQKEEVSQQKQQLHRSPQFFSGNLPSTLRK